MIKSNILDIVSMEKQMPTQELQQALLNYLPNCRWFRTKSKVIAQVHCSNTKPLEGKEHTYFLSSVEVTFEDSTKERYFLPLAFLESATEGNHYLKTFPNSVVYVDSNYPVVVDALYISDFRTALLQLLLNNKTFSEFQFKSTTALRNIKDFNSKILTADQTNTSIIYNEEWFLKIYRKLEDGINPELEIVRFFSERTGFKNAPQYGGSIIFQHPEGERSIVSLVQNKIPNRGEAWTAMLELLSHYYAALMQVPPVPLPELPTSTRIYWKDLPATAKQFITESSYNRVALLGQRTAEMHIALASDTESPAFVPELLTMDNQRELHSDIRDLIECKFNLLEEKLEHLPTTTAAEAKQVLACKTQLLKNLENLKDTPISTDKIRVHGDYHLGQVLYNETDFYIIDFEGEPLRSLKERRTKVSPFKDVAGMIRSFHYAAYGELYLHPEKYAIATMPMLEEWGNYWYEVMQRCFLTSYLDTCQNYSFIPKHSAELRLLLQVYLLEKAVYEVAYELNARPDWLRIPLRGVLQVASEMS